MSAPGPVRYQCGNVDTVIEGIAEAYKLADDLRDAVSNLVQMGSKHGELEEIRSACEKLREWGQEQQDRSDELEKEVEKLESSLDSANETIAELRRELEAALT